VALFLVLRATWLGEAARWCGRPQEAGRLAEEALSLARAHKEHGDEAWALRLLGDVASDREQLSEAEACYRDALALANALGMRPLAAHCRRGLGTLHRRSGARQDAQRELALARDLYRDMGMTFWLERTEV
jgi:tetratricopeptide (TPR) repeat protein